MSNLTIITMGENPVVLDTAVEIFFSAHFIDIEKRTHKEKKATLEVTQGMKQEELWKKLQDALGIPVTAPAFSAVVLSAIRIAAKEASRHKGWDVDINKHVVPFVTLYKNLNMRVLPFREIFINAYKEETFDSVRIEVKEDTIHLTQRSDIECLLCGRIDVPWNENQPSCPDCGGDILWDSYDRWVCIIPKKETENADDQNA